MGFLCEEGMHVEGMHVEGMHVEGMNETASKVIYTATYV
jgi:hypothetical protein